MLTFHFVLSKLQKCNQFVPVCESENALNLLSKPNRKSAKSGSTKTSWNCGKSSCTAKSRRKLPQHKPSMSLAPVPENFRLAARLHRRPVNHPTHRHRPTVATVPTMPRRHPSRINRPSFPAKPPGRRSPKKWNNSSGYNERLTIKSERWSSNNRVSGL